MTSPPHLYCSEDPEVPVAPAAPRVEIVVPVRDEERDLGPSIRRLVTYLRTRFPFTARITIADNASTDRTWAIAAGLADELPAGPGRPAGRRRAAAGRCARRVVGQRRRRARLHGRRPVHRPGRAAAAGRPADLRAQRRGHRHPAGPRRPGGPRAASARSSPAATTCCCAATLAARFSDAQCGFKAIRARRGAAACCRWSRTPAGSSTPSCWCWPSGPGCASTRCRWTGSTTRTPGSTSSPPRWPTCAGIARLGRAPGHRRAIAAAPRWAVAARPRAARPARRRPGGLTRQLVRFAGGRGGQHARLPRCCIVVLRTGLPRAGRPTPVSLLLTAVGNTAANRRFTFGVRGRAGCRPAPGPGPAGLRRRAGCSPAARWPCCTQAAARPPRLARGHRAGRGQPGRHRAPVPAAPGLGVPAPGPPWRRPGPATPP